MHGLMQRHELLISSILVHAARHHGDTEIVSCRADGSIFRTNYAALEHRARKLASVLRDLGVGPGDRVGTLATNSDRHMELYYAISGSGAVCNTINPRLSHDDIAYIADHAQDGVIFCDPAFLEIVVEIASKVECLHAVVVLSDAAAMPQASLPSRVTLHCYEALIESADVIPAWPTVDETTASALCYTSGTTGRPKGVLYSHRSSVLHAMAMNFADAGALRATDRVAVIVPMFHVNAWGVPYCAPMTGTAMLLPGAKLDPASLLSLMNQERATVALGVPTIWLNLINHLRDSGQKIETLKRIVVGGAAMPRALIEAYNQLGIRVNHAWGMTESSPLVTLNAPKPSCLKLEGDARLNRRASQGRVMFGADLCVRDDAGAELPWDGHSQGNLMFRGHWIACGYFRMPHESEDGDWFPTGDVGVFDVDGFITLTDRTKDLIKSGGEWISSIAIENIAVAHPEVAEAAAIAVPHEKWGERPLLIIVPRAGCTPVPEALREFCRGKMPDWSIPDRVIVADSIPHGATGKILKTELRRLYAVPH
jgi:3-(methylthio)propionyl---CoA ligase